MSEPDRRNNRRVSEGRANLFVISERPNACCTVRCAGKHPCSLGIEYERSNSSAVLKWVTHTPRCNAEYPHGFVAAAHGEMCAVGAELQ